LHPNLRYIARSSTVVIDLFNSRRQLPLPPPGRDSLAHPNARRSQQFLDPKPDEVYDNEPRAGFETSNSRYSFVGSRARSTAIKPETTPAAPSPQGPTESDVYDTAIDDGNETETMREIYDNDPFDDNRLNFRRNSDPNLYSEVSVPVPIRPVEERRKTTVGTIDTSLVVRNPSSSEELGCPNPNLGNAIIDHTDGPEDNGDVYDNDPFQTNQKIFSEDGEDYIDMSSPISSTMHKINSQEITSPPEDKPSLDLPELNVLKESPTHSLDLPGESSETKTPMEDESTVEH